MSMPPSEQSGPPYLPPEGMPPGFPPPAQPGYAQPAPGSGFPQPAPRPGYGAPGYGQPAPQPDSGQPPQPGYAAPAPQPGDGAPAYGQPAPPPGYGPPAAQPGYGPPSPQPGYGPPAAQPEYAPPAPQHPGPVGGPAAFPPHQPDPAAPPLRISFGGSATLVLVTGIVCAALALLCLPQIVLAFAQGEVGGGIAFTVVALLVAGFGAMCLLSVRNIRGAGLEIGAAGISATLRGRTAQIGWNEISQVGISIVSSGWDGPGAPPIPTRTRGRSVVRLAGVVPGFAYRPELAFLATGDEPAPYTHKLPLLTGAVMTDARFANVDPAAQALAYFGGARFTGVEQRRGIVGRYS